MAVTQTGTTLLIGNQRSITNYIIVQDGIGAANVVMEDIEDQDGTLETRIVFRNEAQIKLELISKTGATPATDFPIGAKCAVTGLTGGGGRCPSGGADQQCHPGGGSAPSVVAPVADRSAS